MLLQVSRDRITMRCGMRSRIRHPWPRGALPRIGYDTADSDPIYVPWYSLHDRAPGSGGIGRAVPPRQNRGTSNRSGLAQVAHRPYPGRNYYFSNLVRGTSGRPLVVGNLPICSSRTWSPDDGGTFLDTGLARKMDAQFSLRVSIPFVLSFYRSRAHTERRLIHRSV